MTHFLDIGANIGQTFDDFLLKGDGHDGATIWCFEPSPRHLAALRDRLEQLATDEPGSSHHWTIRLCPFGIGDRSGTKLFHEKDDPRGDSFFPETWVSRNYVANRPNPPIAIVAPIIDIVEFIDDNIPAGELVTIKIDAEGSEFDIIGRILGKPRIWPRIDRILIEWHGIDTPENGDAQGMSDKLSAAGIRVEGWPY